MMMKEVEAIDPALVARMVAHIRECDQVHGIQPRDPQAKRLYDEMKDIAALLPTPVHPDVLLAREVIADAVMYGMGIGAEPESKLPRDFRDGTCDAGTLIHTIVSALRDARAQVSA